MVVFRKKRLLGQGIRRFSQLFFLFIFLVLFIRTDYLGSDTIDGAVNIFFRLNPFLGACVMAGLRAIEPLFWPALVVLFMTLVVGRAFCGWFCPMGTLLDIFHRLAKLGKKARGWYSPKLPRLLFFFFLFAAFAGWGIGGYLDPFSLLVRGLAQAVYPLFNKMVVAFFTFTYQDLPEAFQIVFEPLYALLQLTLLASEQKVFYLPLLSLTMLALPLLGELLQPRFFCRNLCPLGGMLGIFSRRALMVGRGGNDGCGGCRICAEKCRMGAIDAKRQLDKERCNLCLECVEGCPQQIIGFGLVLAKGDKTPGSFPSEPVLTRRQFAATAASGLMLPLVTGIDAATARPDPFRIRPPGARAEEEFTLRCLRCAECIQICIGNALQPAFFQAGLAGIFSPVIAARTGYCEFNCTLCGQVCPSGAILPLSLMEKQKTKIGHAFFDTDLCLCYAKGISCMVCEEHCPTPEKAIRFRNKEITREDGSIKRIKEPYVVDQYCIGCGICEYVCPLPGRAAIYVTSAGEFRDKKRYLPMGGGMEKDLGYQGAGYGGD